MNKILANLSLRQRVVIGMVAVLVAAGLYSFVHWEKESDFRPLFTGVAAEDAAGIVQKLKEGGVEYRLPEGGGSVLVPSSRVAELRLAMAAAGLPKTGRIGFELFDKMNLGATEFTEHVNYRRALEGELERSVMVLAEVEQARVHITFPKDSVFLEAQQPAKASVVITIRPGSRLAPQNIQAINHLVASAVEGLSPDAVSVLDSNGNLLGRPKSTSSLDGQEPSEAVLEFTHNVESELQSKINATLEPLLGADKFRTGVSVDCDFSGGEQSEEIFDPARSVMISSQRTEDSTGTATASGVPGTASTLPHPTSKPANGAGRASRVNESITYQSSRTVKKTRMPAGTVKKMSVAVLVDQELKWQKDKSGYQRVLVPPTPEKLKIIHDLVAGITGFSAERGDQLIVETLPFENTLTLEPPDAPGSGLPAKPLSPKGLTFTWDRKTLMEIGGAVLVLLALLFGASKMRKRGAGGSATVKTALPGGKVSGKNQLAAPALDDDGMELKLAEHDALKHKLESQALGALKLTPVITKTAEVLAKHLREKIKQEPETSAQILRAWIHEEEA